MKFHLLLIFIIAASDHHSVTAQEQSAQANVREALVKSMADYRFENAKTQEALRLLPGALLRWSNPISWCSDFRDCPA